MLLPAYSLVKQKRDVDCDFAAVAVAVVLAEVVHVVALETVGATAADEVYDIAVDYLCM